MAQRKAVKVLPEPVGAATSTSSPRAIAGHACACAGVGAGKVWQNHAATAGWKRASGEVMAIDMVPRPAQAKGVATCFVTRRCMNDDAGTCENAAVSCGVFRGVA